MSLFEKYYKKSTGFSKEKGALKCVLDDVKFKVDKLYQGFKRNTARRNALLITSSVLAIYLINKDVVDSRFESFGGAVAEWREDRALRREERRVSSYLDDAKQELGVLESDVSSLYSKKDSLRSLISGLRSRASNEKVMYKNEVYPLMRAVDSLEREVKGLSALKESLESEVSERVGSSRQGIVRRLFSSTGSEPSSSDAVAGSGVSSGYSWFIMPSGGSLSWAASKYHGSANLFGELAQINNISNPDFVLAGQPIRLLSYDLKSDKGVRSGPMPVFVQVRRNENINDFVRRTGVSASVGDVIRFNESLDNDVSGSRFSRSVDGVYLDDSWISRRYE